MKGNPLLKYLVIPFLLIVVFIGIKSLGGGPTPNTEAPAPKLTAEQAKALGVEGDTPSDTLRTVVAEGRELKQQITDVIAQNTAVKQDNETLKQRLANIDQNVDQRLKNAQEQFKLDSQQQQQSVLDGLRKQMDELTRMGQNSASNSDLPIGLGVQQGDGQQFKSETNGSDIVWIDPQDATALDSNGKPITAGNSVPASAYSFPTAFGESVDRGQKALTTGAQSVRDDMGGQQQERKKVRRAYTLPQNSTLMGSVAMSALIGRVPVDGTVNDPYPFKVLIGPDNLTANGIDLPDVAGAVASGTASGDWTLSCVRGQIKSLTFVFTDGTVRTLPAPAQGGNQQNNNQNNQNNSGDQQPIQGGLGWISDPYGIPCIAGERRSNAQQYIGSQALITAAGAGAASLIKTEGSTSSYVSNASGTLGSTGLSGNEAMGKILTQGVTDVSSWVNKLYGQAFAAIYVLPGAQVSLHIDQELEIDYELKGRKVKYASGASHANANLD
ncbi:TIGR03752 family integrating conjugative element protein [Pseudomonas amygdali]|uniref:TIGR03752 family integrating conjugative element protein n=1 Tax=Pseudomonas amygdali TaxID=47877 RepID=UPI000CD1FA35|nr:TIGR03752 family integrating conjugative element protein [Pseudomonas amygdali]POC98567.1 integrating conjugative element protein [Pseudomonas amygdali pv. morsprunorum]POD38577.1 integrating conjugative element protein [Pseudomonas amygdali pv. morsprunorum]POD40782.1 integrating conjugative element protein [Pseudomonas amygdali pv. morsprunorum]POY80373.1 TIGR03752 family integrating conjugative element protein [Pseudomonas amygdali pv. morsprunorum]